MSTQKFLMKFASRPNHTDPNVVHNAHHQALIAKPMHGKFFVQQREVLGVDLDQSNMWLRQVGLYACALPKIKPWQPISSTTKFTSKR
eukprot:3414476-Ditylum_brightwellii.AAC.1